MNHIISVDIKYGSSTRTGGTIEKWLTAWKNGTKICRNISFVCSFASDEIDIEQKESKKGHYKLKRL